jgi:hypothetical protein
MFCRQLKSVEITIVSRHVDYTCSKPNLILSVICLHASLNVLGTFYDDVSPLISNFANMSNIEKFKTIMSHADIDVLFHVAKFVHTAWKS